MSPPPGGQMLPPPVPGQQASALDAKLGALVAEGTTGAGPGEASRRGGWIAVVIGGALTVAAGLGVGWAVGSATRDDTKETSVSQAAGQVSSDAPNADATSPTTLVLSVATGGGTEPLTPATTAIGGQATDVVPTTAGGAGEPARSTAAVVVSTTPVADSVAGGVTTAVSQPPPVASPGTTAPTSIASTTPPPTSPGINPATGGPAAVTTIAAAVPTPTIAPASVPVLPNAVAQIEGGRLTLSGVFLDQASLDHAVQVLGALGVGGVVVDAVVDAAATGSTDIPVLVPAAVLFQPSSAILGDGAVPFLVVVTQFMVGDPSARMSIVGHTDSGGSEAYNFALSQQRIAAVFAFLTGKGVDPTRLDLIPKGETEPIADNVTEAGRSQNRRVELLVSNI